jgi:hypothetical protein
LPKSRARDKHKSIRLIFRQKSLEFVSLQLVFKTPFRQWFSTVFFCFKKRRFIS